MTNIVTDKDTQAAAAFKPEIRAMADVLKSAATMDKTTGVGSVTPETYASLLNQNTSLTEKQIVEQQKFHTTFVAAAHLATGELSIEAMKGNKEITQTEMRIPMVGRDAFEVTFSRQKEVSAGNRDNPQERKTVYGVTRGGFELHAEGNRGELSKVKTFLASQTAELFS